jgi:hypothetical protein
MPKEVTPIQHTAIGGLAGLIEVAIMQPTVMVKNCLQESRPFPANPITYYRGLFINCGAMGPIIATQFGVNRSIEGMVKPLRAGGKLTNADTIGMAMMAGATSSFVGCPAEYLMIAQQRTGMSLLDALKSNVSSLGAKTLFRGLGATMSRESIYAASYMGGVPILREKLNSIGSIADMPGAAFLVSGITAGTIATVLTHPSDTIKTRQQAFPDLKTHPQYRTMLSTAKYVVGEGGAGALFAGLLPRSLRIIGAMFIFNEVKTRAVEYLEGPDAIFP